MAVALLWTGVVPVLAWLTWACLIGRVEHTFSRGQIAGTGTVGSVFLPDLRPVGPDGAAPRVFEDGQPLGPRVDEPATVSRQGAGSYAVSYGAPASPSSTVIHFSASDGSAPRSSGHRYSARYPRRQRRGTIPLLLGAWIVVPAVALRWTRSLRNPRTLRSQADVGGWSLAVLGSLYSVFAVQAWLAPTNAAWFLALGAVVLPPALFRFHRRVAGDSLSQIPRWLPWVAGFLGWAFATAFFGSSHASPPTAAAFAAVCSAGIMAWLGLRGILGREGLSFLPGLLLVASGLSLARDSGFDFASALAAWELSSVWSSRPVNPWTSKFVGHWLLVLTWCAVVALVRRTSQLGRLGRGEVWVPAVGLVAVVVGGSTAAVASLVSSAAAAAVALRWPKGVRRLVVYGLVTGILLAPLLAALPWHASGSLGGSGSPSVLRVLDLDRRAGKWEFSRRLAALRPWTGWGFGASSRLPGGGLSVEEALGPREGVEALPRSEGPVLAGGHPHNAALLVWLDLGVVGALLLAGLILAVGRSIASVEERRGTHAALMGLVTATAVVLVFNYPVWEPEVASILWMSAVLAAAVLPRPAVSRRALLQSCAVIVLILAVGCLALAYERVSRWMTLRDMGDQTTTLEPEAGVLLVGGEAHSLEYDERLDAGAELVQEGSGSEAFLRGWAYGPPGADAPDAVLVFVGNGLVGVVWPERPSSELFLRTERRDVRALVSGFLVPVEPKELDLDAPVTVVTLRSERGFAAELPSLRTASRSSSGYASQDSKTHDGAKEATFTEVECSVQQDELILTNRTVTNSVVEAACQTITAGPLYLVRTSGTVEFQAPRIVIRNGFTVEGSFTAITTMP